jgi:hypothetical protein
LGISRAITAHSTKMVKWSSGVVSEPTRPGVDNGFRDLEPVRIDMEAGIHSIWISEQIQELGR